MPNKITTRILELHYKAQEYNAKSHLKPKIVITYNGGDKVGWYFGSSLLISTSLLYYACAPA